MGKKKFIPKKNFKFVRVDHHTIIEVDAGIPDEEAIAHFLERSSLSKPSYLRKKEKNDGTGTT